MDHEEIGHFLLDNGADWINWQRSTPIACNMEGAWRELAIQKMYGLERILNKILHAILY